jgi:hypothetical protein
MQSLMARIRQSKASGARMHQELNLSHSDFQRVRAFRQQLIEILAALALPLVE